MQHAIWLVCAEEGKSCLRGVYDAFVMCVVRLDLGAHLRLVVIIRFYRLSEALHTWRW